MFFKSLVRKKFLIAENDFKSSTCLPEVTRFDNYEVCNVLKNGELNKLFFVKNQKGEVFVIKHLVNTANNNIKEQFNQEFRILSLLSNHPSIVKLIKYFKDEKFAVLEYIKGFDLSFLINSGSLMLKQKILIAEQIIEVCSYIHHKGVVHGDIHANQFIVNDNLCVKIIDFGYSFFLGESTVGKTIIRGGVNVYLEPENITSNIFGKYKKYMPNYQSDVYRLGILLYILFYEKKPISGFTWKDLYQKKKIGKIIFHKKTPKNEKIPIVFIQLMKKSLSPKNKRILSAIEMYSFLKKKPNLEIIVLIFSTLFS